MTKEPFSPTTEAKKYVEMTRTINAANDWDRLNSRGWTDHLHHRSWLKEWRSRGMNVEILGEMFSAEDEQAIVRAMWGGRR